MVLDQHPLAHSQGLGCCSCYHITLTWIDEDLHITLGCKINLPQATENIGKLGKTIWKMALQLHMQCNVQIFQMHCVHDAACWQYY